MKTILSELYSGEIYPDECIIPEDKEYKELLDKIMREREYFDKFIPESDAKRYDDLNYLQMEESLWLTKEAFTYGYRLATVIMLEVLTNKEALYRK